jgi:hypothetical protein
VSEPEESVDVQTGPMGTGSVVLKDTDSESIERVRCVGASIGVSSLGPDTLIRVAGLPENWQGKILYRRIR